jgi:uncharacterized membrane protein
MADQKQAWTDERAEQVIGQLLRAGVILSVVVVLIGAALYLLHHGGQRPDYHAFRGEPRDLRSIPEIFRGALQLRSPHVIQSGLILLLATPVARVAFSIFAFAAQRDRTYVVVTMIVLAILIASIAGLI